jgi:hypothetical protein
MGEHEWGFYEHIMPTIWEQEGYEYHRIAGLPCEVYVNKTKRMAKVIVVLRDGYAEITEPIKRFPSQMLLSLASLLY